MKDRSIKLIRFYLKNYAPFYESMGIKTFQFDRTNSPNNMILILAGNGVGKSYLMSELTPEPLETRDGRDTNRFIPNEEGEKKITYLVDDSIEYTCHIIYSADRRKTTCFFTKCVNGVEEELNPNGNVSSYLEMCRIHLGYYKTYKNIGHIADGVKNIVSMSQAERQNLITSWLPDMAEFLVASKRAQKKYNQVDKEIKSLTADIAKISLEEYTSKRTNIQTEMNDISNRLLLIRDNISKLEVYCNRLKSFSRGNLLLKKKKFFEDIAAYETKAAELKGTMSKYAAYISGTEAENKAKLQELLLEKEKELGVVGADESRLNESISRLSISIERIQGELKQNLSDKDLVSVNSSIELLKKDIETSKEMMKDALEKHMDFADVKYSKEAKEFARIILNTFENMCSTIDKMNINCKGFSIRDIMQNTVIDNLEKKIKSLNDANAALEGLNDTISKQILEKERNKIDASILDYAPKGCSKETCKLLATLIERSRINDDISGLNTSILENKNKIAANNADIERAKLSMNDVKNALMDVTSINDSLMKINNKFIHLPKSLFERINSSDPAYIAENIQVLIEEIKEFDEYLSVCEKIETASESITNLQNVSKILTMKDAKSKELSELIAKRNSDMDERKVVTEKKVALVKERDEIQTLSNSVEVFSQKKAELDKIKHELDTTKEKLVKENECVYYKGVFETCMSSLKLKEIDYSTRYKNLEEELSKCNSQINSRDTLETRKKNLEIKRNIYELAYNAWNSKTGYPSLIIKDFLSEVAYETNRKLDEIWGGLIHVDEKQMRDIAENEFCIPIIRGNTIVPDVRGCSKAEMSTIALALSFAIITVSVKNSLYNIIRIDEADSGYDGVRRQVYLDILTSQIEAINCKSAFIVTHNQMFDNVACDVILLKDYETLVSASSLVNKNIIYSFDKTGI